MRTAAAQSHVPQRPARHGPPPVQAASAQALRLQRSIGNRATARVLARATKTIQGEEVNVASDAEAKEADDIITRISANYGIKINSGELVKATKERYTKAPAAELMKVQKRAWNLRELRAVEKACKYFAPILGKAREKSSRKGAAQDVTAFGKATHSVDTNTAKGVADDTTLGEYYRGSTTAGLYKVAENDTTFAYKDIDKNLEWICTHELAHGLMDYIAEDLRKAAGYWKDSSTKTGSGEEPISPYGKTSLGEDVAESTAAYFMKKADFEKTCPKRFAVVDAAVKAWTPAAAPSPAPPAPAPAPAAGVKPPSPPPPVPVGTTH